MVGGTIRRRDAIAARGEGRGTRRKDEPLDRLRVVVQLEVRALVCRLRTVPNQHNSRSGPTERADGSK